VALAEKLNPVSSGYWSKGQGSVYFLNKGDLIKVEVSCRITPTPPRDGCDLTAYYSFLGNNKYYNRNILTKVPRDFVVPSTGYYFIGVKYDHYMRVTRIESNYQIESKKEDTPKVTANDTAPSNNVIPEVNSTIEAPPKDNAKRGNYTVDTSVTGCPPIEWWIDPKTNLPNVIIVVGAQSNAVDVQTATDLASAVANMSPKEVNPNDLIFLDLEINLSTNSKNLVVIGSPNINFLTKDLVDMGASTVNWSKSPGQWEWIADPFAVGYDVLIIGGTGGKIVAQNGPFIVREVISVPLADTKPTKEYYAKRTENVESEFYTLPDKDDDGVPDKYDKNPDATENKLFTYFSWDYNGKKITWMLEAPEDTVDFYDRVRPKSNFLRMILGDSLVESLSKTFGDLFGDPWILNFINPDDKITQTLASALLNESVGKPPEMKAEFVLRFVQNIEYKDDETIATENYYYDYPRFPSQSLFDRTGDCEDLSILLASLLKQMNYDVCLLNPPGHMAVGVNLEETIPGGVYYMNDGKKYYYCETTDIGWTIGSMPSDLEEYEEIKIYPVA